MDYSISRCPSEWLSACTTVNAKKFWPLFCVKSRRFFSWLLDSDKIKSSSTPPPLPYAPSPVDCHHCAISLCGLVFFNLAFYWVTFLKINTINTISNNIVSFHGYISPEWMAGWMNPGTDSQMDGRTWRALRNSYSYRYWDVVWHFGNVIKKTTTNNSQFSQIVIW